MKSFVLELLNVDVKIRDNCLILRFPSRYRSLSSTVYNGGTRSIDAVVTMQVPKDYDHSEPEKQLRSKIGRLGLHPERTIGFMTAVDVATYKVSGAQRDEVRVVSVVTAGISNPIAAGDTVSSPSLSPGTINTITLVDANLTVAGLVDAVKTATEAKSVALVDLKVQSRFSQRYASGTTSDAIAVACTGRGSRMKYAGTATVVGELIGKSVYTAVKLALRK